MKILVHIIQRIMTIFNLRSSVKTISMRILVPIIQRIMTIFHHQTLVKTIKMKMLVQIIFITMSILYIGTSHYIFFSIHISFYFSVTVGELNLDLKVIWMLYMAVIALIQPLGMSLILNFVKGLCHDSKDKKPLMITMKSFSNLVF